MPIYRLIEREAFEPEHIQAITAAFEEVCRELGLAAREDPLRDIVARAIIKCAQMGEHDPDRLRKCAHDEIKKPH
jgi:hypothetical protein